MEIDHYVVLGLPSGEQGAKLTHAEINKAYKTKALELHPDKRPDDPNANVNFLKLHESYEILKDGKKRRELDDWLSSQRVQAVQPQRQRESSHCDSRKRKMMDDLDKRERRASVASDPDKLAREEEERYYKVMKEGKEKVISKILKDLERNRTLKVDSFVDVEYSAETLKELFGKFGAVEDVVVLRSEKKKKKKWSALVVMDSTYAKAVALKGVLGDVSNPLRVRPL